MNNFTTTNYKGNREINWKKKDGPLLYYGNGSSRFLTWKERFLLWIKYYNINNLN